MKFVVSLIFVLTIAHAKEIFIKESNLWELDQNSFYKVAHQLHKHVIIELYSTESWCSKLKIASGEFFLKTFLIAVHCRTLHPIFRKIAEKYRENKDIVFARMDLSSFKPVDLKVILQIYFAYAAHPK